MRSVIFDPAMKKQNIVVLVCCFLMQGPATLFIRPG